MKRFEPDSANLTSLPGKPRIDRGGDYAVLRHSGPYPEMKEAYRWLYREWLPQSGRCGADAPPFELYVNMPGTTAPEDLLTDIHVSLR